MFSGMPYLPQLFSPGRGDLTENIPSKSKEKKHVALCDSHICLELERFNFISHLASYRNWGTKMTATVFFGDTGKSYHCYHSVESF